MEKIQVFIDGACHLCSFEARLLRRADIKNKIEFVNIASPSFTGAEYPGRRFETYMQVRLENGNFVEGVEAFSEIYSRIPRFRWLGLLLKLPLIRHLAWVGYFIFAHSRKYLPQRSSCEI